MNILFVRFFAGIIFFLLIFRCDFPKLEKRVNDSESRFISELVATRTQNGNPETNSSDSTGGIFRIGGNVTGIPLNETLIIQNNFSEVLSVFTNGSFSFIQTFSNQANFYVSILRNPSGRNCVVQNGIGKIENSNFTGVMIVCQ